jgi:hypothetical protein
LEQRRHALEIALSHGQATTESSIAAKEFAFQERVDAVQASKALSHDLSEAHYRAEEAEMVVRELHMTVQKASRALEAGLGLQQEVRATYAVWEGHCLALSLSMGLQSLPKRYLHEGLPYPIIAHMSMYGNNH